MTWPACAKIDCGLPAFFKLELIEEGRPITVFLCFVHILEAGDCMEEVAFIRVEERKLLGDDLPPI